MDSMHELLVKTLIESRAALLSTDSRIRSNQIRKIDIVLNGVLHLARELTAAAKKRNAK